MCLFPLTHLVYLNSLDKSIANRNGVWLIFTLPRFIEIPEVNANRVDPERTPLSASVASDLDLLCLPIFLLRDTRHKWVENCNYRFRNKKGFELWRCSSTFVRAAILWVSDIEINFIWNNMLLLQITVYMFVCFFFSKLFTNSHEQHIPVIRRLLFVSH